MPAALNRCKICERESNEIVRGMCPAHYQRWRKHGDPGSPDVGTLIPKPPVCSFDGCDRTDVMARALCSMHYSRVIKHGDPSVNLKPKNVEIVGYSHAHRRIRKSKGRAQNFNCVDCGRQAEHWAYDHEDPNELIGITRDRLVPYSLNHDHYQPMCAKCHFDFDKNRGAF